jgi:hypothetical protein
MGVRGSSAYAAWRAAAVVLGLAALAFTGVGAAGAAVAAPAAPSAPVPRFAASVPRVVTPDDDVATKFHVDFTVNPDGSIDVAEHISWHFPQGEERHGIERFIVVRAGYGDSGDQYREYPISGISASSPTGARSQVGVTDAPDGRSVRIRVGDPDRTVTGVQQYVVRYHLDSIVNGFPDHAELYYNLVDTSNNAVYHDVSASVTGPAPSTLAACFSG